MTHVVSEEDHLAHYGILRKSGRYPWGSGGTTLSRSQTFLDVVQNLERQGLSQAEIARGFHTKEHPFNTNDLRALKTIALNQVKQDKIRQAERLKERGWSNIAIGERMGINESSVRALLAPGEKEKVDILQSTANMLKRQVDEKEFLDVGLGVEHDLPLSSGGNIGISRTKFKTALAMLKEEGYGVHEVPVPQLSGNSGKNTTTYVLTKPGVTQKDAWMARNRIRSITEFSEDGGRSFLGLKEPISISSSRIKVRHAEDGGDKADGVIFVRRGVEDVSIGAARYAQVRIMVDKTHYLKGMAVYKDDLPDGVDLEFNTNKSKRVPLKHDDPKAEQVFKPLKGDEDNPFGSVVRQRIVNGKVTSAMNIVGSKEGAGEEGSWDTWARNLPAQMLSKQHPDLAKAQLAMTHERRQKEYEEISALNHPTVRKKLLEDFADGTDSAAVHLRAANMPRQATKVILPVSSIKDTEVYAPSFKNGERVALVRFPHGGTFEIPQLTVNNKNPEARKLLGTDTQDAIGIHHKVAQRLSGADFDGDTVLVIPNPLGLIKSTPPLEKLKDFDPQAFKRDPSSGAKKVTDKRKQLEMGNVSNLITDMTIRGASPDKIARAVRHSMVCIDAEKHDLDISASARDNGIRALKQEFQGGPQAGAATLLSRANAKVRVDEKKPRKAQDGGPVDRETGERVFVKTGATYTNKQGKVIKKTQVSRGLAEVTDAHELVSKPTGTRIEKIYADHSNKLKALANQARKDAVLTKPPRIEKSAKVVYASEVKSLEAKLKTAERNAPLERQAQRLAAAVVSQKRQADPNLEPEDIKKIKNQALAEMRARTGAKKQDVEITPKEWDAIQAGAISNHKLEKILLKTDIEVVKQYATPKAKLLMSSAKASRARQMLASGYTQADVAAALGVSLTTLKTSLSE